MTEPKFDFIVFKLYRDNTYLWNGKFYELYPYLHERLNHWKGLFPDRIVVDFSVSQVEKEQLITIKYFEKTLKREILSEKKEQL